MIEYYSTLEIIPFQIYIGLAQCLLWIDNILGAYLLQAANSQVSIFKSSGVARNGYFEIFFCFRFKQHLLVKKERIFEKIIILKSLAALFILKYQS